MQKSRILSPMAYGNGAHIVHSQLAKKISGYHLVGYNPYLTMLPFALPLVAPCRRADLIHSTPDYAIFHHSKKTPLIVTFHNYVLDPWMRRHSSMLQRIHYSTDLRLWTRLAVGKAKRTTAVSQFLADLVRRDLGLDQPVKVIYNGIDVNLFRPLPAAGAKPKKIRVFFSGNLTRRKGVQWLPSIARRLSPNIIVYYTSGLRTGNILPSENRLRSVGRIPFDDMPARYGEMDILLMPAMREGFGLAVAEAMACGLPVVASACSSIPELIDDGRGGYLCPVGDVKAFAEKINRLADSAKLRKEMGEYNRAKVEEMFTLDRMAIEYRTLFEEVMDG